MFVRAVAALLLCGCASGSDLWNGITPGPFAAGFRFQRTVDPTRTINARERGTELGLAIWYPAQPSAGPVRGVSQLEYRLLMFAETPSPQGRSEFRDAEAGMMVAWRHVGIVDLSMEQARAALDASGRALRDVRPATGKFPVVVVMGGPFYLSTTAEILASHGYLVVAPVRFTDQVNEVPSLNYTWSLESSIRDAEWALAELSRDPAADMSFVSAIGHGGGGFQALLLAMRNRAIHAVVNLDAANFSSRTNPRQAIFYDPRLLRVPYLFFARAETRRDLDQFSDFENLRFSKRYEVILQDPAIRHHDLSDIGRAVSATLGIRGEAQAAVLRHYSTVQRMLIHFLDSRGGEPAEVSSKPDYAVTVREAVEPAPTTNEVLRAPDAYPVSRLEAIHRTDPDAPLFSEGNLQSLMTAVRTASLARFALQLHPGSMAILQLASASLESSGDVAGARELASRCAALPPPANDWRAAAAQSACRERAQRLQR